MNKPKLLWCSEASYLSTGYAVYSREILSRLYDSGLFDIYEFGSYGSNEDPRSASIKWNFIGNLPQRGNKQEEDNYNSHPVNQFGQWKFEHVCGLVKPDIVYSNTDYWMASYIENSPYRPYFHWSWLVACDAAPQNIQWIYTYKNCDSVFTYSDWAIDILKNQSNNEINVVGSATGGGSNDLIQEDKLSVKKEFGLEKMKIIGTVMRNQRRKLFPDLLLSFRNFLDKTKRDDVLLYLHTSFPDKNPWDIPELINEYSLGHKVLMTYRCGTGQPNNGCGLTFPAFFSDYGVICKRCRQMATCASVQNGVDDRFLSKIYNLFDLYVQYANSEGCGYPPIEAAKCGTPVMEVDYSAMTDVVRKLNGIPLKVKTLYKELETGCNRAIPDNDFFVDKLIEFFSKPQSIRNRDGILAKQGHDKYFTFDKAAQIYIDYWKNLNVENKWNSPPSIRNISSQINHSNLTTSQYCKFLICDVLGEPEKLGTFMHARLIRDLNYGHTIGWGGGFEMNELSMLDQSAARPFNRDDAYNQMKHLAEKRNFFEQKRTNG